ARHLSQRGLSPRRQARGAQLREGSGGRDVDAGALALVFAALAGIDVSAAARAIQPGELVVLTIQLDHPAAQVRVRAFDRELQPFVDANGVWRVLVGIDLDTKPGRHPVAIDAGPEHTTYDLEVKPKRFRTRTLSVDEAFVTPPPSAAERIARENELLQRTWESSAPERLWALFERPVADP